MRLTVRVRPGASRTVVGGAYDVVLVSGATSRTKVLDVRGGSEQVLRDLLGHP